MQKNDGELLLESDDRLVRETRVTTLHLQN